MNIDLTIGELLGQQRDVSIRAPEGTRVGAVLAEVTAPHDGGLWSGSDRVTAAAMLGGPGLRSGCVLSTTAPAPAAELTRAGLQVQVCGGPDAGRRLALGRGLVTVGRAPDCDLVLHDPAVSRRHSCLTVTAVGVSVRDLGSTHRTLLDARPVDPDGADFTPGTMLRLGDTFLTLRAAAEPPAAVRAGPDGTRLVNRAPRTAGTPPAREIELPVARLVSPQRVQWWAALVPALAGILLAVLLRSPQFLVFAMLSPMILLGTALGERLHCRRGRRRAVGWLRRQRRAARDQVVAALAAEVAHRRTIAPDPATVEETARTPSILLWQRRRADPDLLVVRLGLGELPASTRVRTGAEICSAGVLAAVPIEVDLGQGPLGIAAPRGIQLGVGRWLVGQLATLCSPADVEISLLLADDVASDWTWARWLPHLGGRVARTAEQRHELLAELQHLIDQRGAHGPGDQRWNGPWQVLVVDSSACLGELAALQAVLDTGPRVGVTAVCVETDHARLPQSCSSVARTIGETGSRLELHDATGAKLAVIADQVNAAWSESVARALAPLVDAGADTRTAIPDSARLLDVCDLRTLDPARIAERWARSDGRAGTLLGVGANGPVGIDLVSDGPHVLIAGTTGSGKSELLQTLIAGLAVNHPPDQLSFVLVDYKGGAAFAQCSRLPHAAGVVTDLDAQLTARALSSLECELRRREQLFARTGARDLEAHRAAGPAEPLARLVLVVDEFATLAEELPSFVTGLVGIAQRGRSLGVHLVLATQRPGGVVSPEIRANTTLRIALRVTDAAESADVIGADNAVHLSRRTPGRAYLRCGPRLIELQTARVAGPAPASADQAVVVAPLDEWRGPLNHAPAAAGDATDLAGLVEAVRVAARAAGHRAAPRPWLPPLPSDLATSPLVPEDAGPAVIAVGVMDLPAAQAQPPLCLDLAAGPSILLAGEPRSGRTSTLLSFAFHAAARLSPGELHLHAVDAAGGGLTALTRLPHCGTVADRREPAVVDTLLLRLGEQTARRQAELVELGVSSTAEARASGHPLALTLLLIDGWENFVAMAEEFDGARSVGRVLELLRAGPAAGLTIALSGDRGVLATRPASVIGTKYLLRLADRSDYGLVGLPPCAVPESMPPGRAVCAPDGVEVQFARPPLLREFPDRTPSTASAAVRVRPLPARVGLDDLPRCAAGLTLGVGGDAAEPVYLDLFAGDARLLIAGPPRSGRSTAIATLLREARSHGVRVLLAAPRRSPLAAQGAAQLITPDDEDCTVVASAGGRTLLLVDDGEAFLDTPVGDALEALVRRNVAGLAVVVAGRADELAVTYRGVSSEVRRSRCALLLHPGPGDGDLVGLRLSATRSVLPPGRGLLVGDPAWGGAFQAGPVPIQVAAP